MYKYHVMFARIVWEGLVSDKEGTAKILAPGTFIHSWWVYMYIHVCGFQRHGGLIIPAFSYTLS